MSSPDAPDLDAITQTINIAHHTAFMNPGMLWAREMERVCGGALDVIAALRAAETKLAAVQALTEKWENATELTTGQPSVVTQAFAQPLRTILDGDRPES